MRYRPIASNDRIVLNYDLERMCNKAAVAHFKVLPYYLPDGTLLNHKEIAVVAAETWDHESNTRRRRRVKPTELRRSALKGTRITV
jgi:hypothetical protein